MKESSALSHKVGVSFDDETYRFVKKYQEEHGIKKFARAVSTILEEYLRLTGHKLTQDGWIKVDASINANINSSFGVVVGHGNTVTQKNDPEPPSPKSELRKRVSSAPRKPRPSRPQS